MSVLLYPEINLDLVLLQTGEPFPHNRSKTYLLHDSLTYILGGLGKGVPNV